jgi:hypothetical protein
MIAAPSPDYSDFFNFERELTLKEFLEGFDNGISFFNSKVKEFNDKNKQFNSLYQDTNENILKRQKQETINRGNTLITEKIDYYNDWIKFMYYILRITIVVLGVLVIIAIVYKQLNKSN